MENLILTKIRVTKDNDDACMTDCDTNTKAPNFSQVSRSQFASENEEMFDVDSENSDEELAYHLKPWYFQPKKEKMPLKKSQFC